MRRLSVIVSLVVCSAADIVHKPPVQLTAQEDRQRLLDLLQIKTLRSATEGRNSGPSDPLLLKSGRKVTTADQWWKQRRAQIVEDFDREVYGRAPKVTPLVRWETINMTDEIVGDLPVLTKKLIGHVDNSSYSSVTVAIQLTLSTPANIRTPVPVTLAWGDDSQDSSNLRELTIAKGWAFAVLSPASIQADHGEGLTQGIIGLVNKGQPRKADDWGTLRAWAWGASRALDYFEKDERVDARRVALEGHSRYGQAAAVAMAYDSRFDVAFISSHLVESLAGVKEYHWMAGNFLKYAGPLTGSDLPVKSHHLVALCAPRPIFIGAGTENSDDAKGMFLAAVAVGPVYQLLGKTGLGAVEFPPIETSLVSGEVAFRQHRGGPTLGSNWPIFLDFAARHFKAIR